MTDKRPRKKGWEKWEKKPSYWDLSGASNPRMIGDKRYQNVCIIWIVFFFHFKSFTTYTIL